MYREGFVTISKNTALDYRRILRKCQAGGVPPLSIASPVVGTNVVLTFWTIMANQAKECLVSVKMGLLGSN
jgi:hypothetical protein